MGRHILSPRPPDVENPYLSPYTALAVNNEPLQSSTCTKHRYERLAEALQLYSSLQRSTLYILYTPPSESERVSAAILILRTARSMALLPWLVTIDRWQPSSATRTNGCALQQRLPGTRGPLYATPLAAQLPARILVFRPPPKKERKKTDNPGEGWENGTPPPHRDFKERGVGPESARNVWR